MNPVNTSNQDSSQDWTFKTEEEILQEKQAVESSTNELVFSVTPPSEIHVNLTSDLKMEFFDHGTQVGSMDWKTGNFIGQADESAKAFLKVIQFYIDAYIHNKVSSAQVELAEYMEKFK